MEAEKLDPRFLPYQTSDSLVSNGNSRFDKGIGFSQDNNRRNWEENVGSLNKSHWAKRVQYNNSVVASFPNFIIEPIHEKYAWRICDFVTVNSGRLKLYFPRTLEKNLTPDLAQIFVNEKVRQFERKEEFLFVLKNKKDRTLIGLVYIKDLDWNTKQAEVAYCIGYQYERKGLMTAAVKTLSDHAFEKLGLDALRAIIHKSNSGSIRVAEKCGYIWKSTLLKEHTPPGESALDMELYELKKSKP